MKQDFLQLMKDATASTRAGDLSGATAAIQAALRSSSTIQPDDSSSKPGAAVGADVAPDGTGSSQEQQAFRLRSFADDSGNMDFRLFSPQRVTKTRAPLVVMLHGCTQDALDFSLGTQMNRLGQALEFHVLYPQQSRSANAQKCWNWFDPDHQKRGGGEPELISRLTRNVILSEGVDPRRVYVAGLSAGGAMAAIMGRAYPDIFAAIGVHSGLAPECAHDIMTAMRAMKAGGTGRKAQRAIPTVVFQGMNDHTVSSKNADQVIYACAGDVELANKDGADKNGSRVFTAPGSPVVIAEEWLIAGLGHSWSGGSPQGSFTSESGPDASAEMVRFFSKFELTPASRY